MPKPATKSESLVREIESVGRELRQLLTPLIERIDGAPPRPSRFARAVGIDKSLASRLIRAMRADTDLELMSTVPSPTGLRILAHATADQVDSERIEELHASADRFQQLLDSTPGGRSAIDAQISRSSTEVRAKREHIAKQASFKSMSFLLGHPGGSNMIRTSIGFLVGLALAAGPSHAEVAFEFILEGGTASEISADGSVVVGNTSDDYEAFRWTEATGMVPLGRASGPVLGRGGGVPGVSADGTRVSSSILGADSTYWTQGLWTEGQGWQELMPPTPPDGGLVDLSYGAVWNLSGNGNTVVGLYWLPNLSPVQAHASAWTAATGVVDLGSSGRSSRADGVNHDGSVVVGWDAAPSGGQRRPAAWVGGNLSVLSEVDGLGQAYVVNGAGTIASGYQHSFVNGINQLAVWRWNGSGWDDAELLGVLPGTLGQGRAQGTGISEDGSLIVGYNTYAGDPFGATGFIWTEETGIIDVEDFLADNGITLPGFDLKSLSDVTPDGTVLVGWGEDTTAPFTRRTFLIRLGNPVGAPVLADAPSPLTLEAWPNPLRGRTTLTLAVPGTASGRLAIYDATGRIVRELTNGRLAAGSHRIEWDGRNQGGSRVAAGVYFSRFEAGTLRATRRLVVVR